MAGLNLFTNNAATTLASGILSGATSLTVATGTGALFPNPTAGQYFYCTLANNAGTVEIIKVTARSGDTFSTIVRGQDGTSAVAWNSGDKVELRLVNADLTNFPQLDSTNTFSQQQTMSNLTASKPVFTDGSKGLVSTGTVPTDQGGTGLTTFTAANNAIYSTSGSALTAGTLPIAAGGTGATTKTAAFDALAPTTTNGDMMYFNGTDVVRLGIGSSGQVLKVAGGIPSWAADAGGFTTMSVYTSGTSTFTVPTGVTTIKVTVVGGGGGGSIDGNPAGTAGGTTSFGALCSATGGGGSSIAITTTVQTAGSGGTGTGGLVNITGSAGSGYRANGILRLSGWGGRNGVVGSYGAGGSTTSNVSPSANCSAIGGAAGGAAVGYYTVTPGTNYTVTVGGAGSNNSGSFTAPVAGICIVEY